MQVGKWDVGMATMDETPRGKGYDSSLSFFYHGTAPKPLTLTLTLTLIHTHTHTHT